MMPEKKTERDKFLTEAMGECWHSNRIMRHISTQKLDVGGVILADCPNCKAVVDLNNSADRLNFSTWEGFGKLWKWAQEQEWWYRTFASGWDTQSGYSAIRTDYVNPDNFANAVYTFLKKKKEKEI